jgi:hypothetical protein
MHHLGAEYFGAEDQPLQFKFKTLFGSLSTPEMGEETIVSSALRSLALLWPFRCHFAGLVSSSFDYEKLMDTWQV